MLGTMLLVGGSRGIGLATAEHFASRVGMLHCVSRTPSPHGVWIEADVGAEAGIELVASRLAGSRLDALVFAGGTWETGAFTGSYDFEHGPADDIDRVLAVNLMAPIKLVRALLACLRRSDNPRVLLLGALSGLDNAATREVANSASKYGLRGAAHALRHAVPEIGVTVINPGNVATAEVEADIAAGRFGPQVPIPLADLMAVIECALRLSPASVATEVNLAQMRSG